MRSVWSGTVSFAPVARAGADLHGDGFKDPRLHVLHRRDRAGRPRRVRKDTGEHVDFGPRSEGALPDREQEEDAEDADLHGGVAPVGRAHAAHAHAVARQGKLGP
jgi:hypothetical protein